ncbi:hypothetical protein ABZZ04_38315 [Streptomyces sp. NPDC006435]|uniref:hypothetical protein n=1 Tax=Streptomyces sp. NPDC006435 TaxID=3154300 RepID=UPI0033A4D44E
MLGTAFGVLDRVLDVFVVVTGLGCVWLGCQALLRPRRPPEPIHGPVWVVRSWGLGFVLLGISLAVEMVLPMTGRESGLPADVIRLAAGPLVAGSIVAAFVVRGWQRRRSRTAKGRRRRA